ARASAVPTAVCGQGSHGRRNGLHDVHGCPCFGGLPDKEHGEGGAPLSIRRCFPLLALLLTLGLAAAAAAQQTPVPDIDASSERGGVGPDPAQGRNEVPNQAVGYDEEGNLLVIALMSDVGQLRSATLDLIAVVLSGCILPNGPRTCRFVAF